MCYPYAIMNTINEQRAVPSTLNHPGGLPQYLSQEDFAQFLSLQPAVLEKFESLILELENGDLENAPKEMYRILHTMKGESGFLGLKAVEAVCHRTEDRLSGDVHPFFAGVLLQVKDWLADTFRSYAGGPQPGQNQHEIMNRLDEYASPPSDPDIAQADSAEEREIPEPVTLGDNSKPGIKQPIQVDSERLDHLIDMIGELATAEAMVTRHHDASTAGSPAYKNALRALSDITRELQKVGLALRMVPLKGLFSRMKRVARDLAAKSGKSFDFIVKGEDTKLDKNLVDGLNDPLIHIIRNSVDHGIESGTDQRIQSGKPERATLTLEGYNKGGSLYIEVADDGAGIDRESLIEKAWAAGIIEDSTPLDDDDVNQLIFHPGLSTAEKITDISGRGIGMDVVKNTITGYNGRIRVESRQGKGTKIQIRLPLTLAIMDGMVVGVRGHRYVVPTLSVVTSLQLIPGMISRVLGTGECINVHGNLVPLVRLDRVFNLDQEPGETGTAGSVAIVVEDAGNRAALVIDRLLAKQNIVRKDMGHLLQHTPGISGSTIMPDGQVCLILDIGAIISSAVAG
ncbi:MAG: hypothetical protein D3926_24875 [Desulfobacteraceae bacterium]|nr:MAG: hypothetical protein D3926_24875 [Desulfobacteraceae bacterium]